MTDIKHPVFEKIFLWNNTQSSLLLSSLSLVPGTSEHKAVEEGKLAFSEQDVALAKEQSRNALCMSEGGVQCSVCDVALNDRQEQLLHYSTPYHQHNQERLLRGLQCLTLHQFHTQAPQTPDDSSLSESDEDDQDSCSDSQSDQEANDDDSRESVAASVLPGDREPRLYFLNSALGCVVSVCRALLLPRKVVIENGQELVSAATELPGRQQWAILLQSGGHFAGAVFRGNEVLVHKTLHSYTVRAGQGKSQGSYDGSCGSSHPRSAGASLRRYNEAAHAQHVQEVVQQWLPLLQCCHLIFTRVSRRKRSLLFRSGKSCLIDPSDTRLRNIPFSTRKPTFAELKRVHGLLAEVRVHGSMEAFLATLGDKLRPGRDKSCGRSQEQLKRERCRRFSRSLSVKSRSNSHSSSSKSNSSDEQLPRPSPTPRGDLHVSPGKPAKKKKKKKQKISGNNVDIVKSRQETIDEIDRERSMEKLREELYTVCRCGNLQRMKALLAFCQSGDINDAKDQDLGAGVVSCVERYWQSISLLDMTMTETHKTALHVATENNKLDLVKWLLEEGGCDPSTQDSRHRAPYSCCSTNAGRLLYRRYRAQHPDAHNYAKSAIPAPLNPEEEKRRNKEKEAKRIAQKARQKENKLKKQRLLEEQKERQRYLNLSDREKRALAAERRLLSSQPTATERPVLLRCFQCACDISGLVPYEYSDNQFCSTACVRTHRDLHKTSR
ncbi:ankyrin repeat and zinc finger domain-containing protein 1 [Hyalella azteca]|uniref:Ankyrin repeat and zinc finger domain-containing protein 1 n=1 Tax=Hyalella azteca TaxID=294128 RepID=A0A8B7NWA2_HYAAZ|nr:ankyrin repeat and zinc finger domain-containing protein 1 [Hyalella azteca]